jgi:Transposase DDE domain
MKDSGTRGLTFGVGTDHLPRPSNALGATFCATQGWSFFPPISVDTVLAFPCRMVQVVVTLRSPSRASRRLVRPLPRSRSRSVFCFFEHPVHFAREQAYEGKYVIQTEEPNLSAVDAVRLYKELSEVERSFANLKDVIDMRPIYHQTDERVQAHIFVAALAFLLHRAIEKKLKAARLDLSATGCC